MHLVRVCVCDSAGRLCRFEEIPEITGRRRRRRKASLIPQWEHLQGQRSEQLGDHRAQMIGFWSVKQEGAFRTVNE